MTISMVLNDAVEKLKQSQVQDPAYEAGLLLSWLIKKSYSYLYTHPEAHIPEEDIPRYKELVNRRCQGEPIQYIMGECEFMSLSFKVNPSVLIPRGDTELLLEAALYALNSETPFFNQPMLRLNQNENIRALDIGTGSGCLAVTLAKLADKANITIDALDISQDALKTAKANAIYHSVEDKIRFIKIDFLSCLDFVHEGYHLILSNPPYIAFDEKPSLDKSVKDYEPAIALFAEEEGLVFYKKIAEAAKHLLVKDGIIIVECGYAQAAKVKEIFSSHGMVTQGLFDLAGIERAVAARFKQKHIH